MFDDLSIRDVPVALVDPGVNDRTRFNEDELSALAASINRVGLAQPITVTQQGSRYRIVAGERRFRAIRDVLKWDRVPVIVRALSALDASTIMLVENIQRVDLDPIDEALAYRKRIDEQGLTVDQVAELAGVRPSRVQWRLDLLRLDDDALWALRTGNLPVAVAWEMSHLDSQRQRMVLLALAQTGLTYTQAKAMCARLLEEQQTAPLFDDSMFMRIEEYVVSAQSSSAPTRRDLEDVVRLMAAALDGHDLLDHPVVRHVLDGKS